MSPIPTRFPKFPSLPTELRLKIFSFIRHNETHSRILELDIDPSRHYTPSERKSHIPSSLHINHESRTEALRCYTALISKHEQACYPPGYRKHMIFIDVKDDLIVLDFERLEWACEKIVLDSWANLGEICKGVKRLVIMDFDPIVAAGDLYWRHTATERQVEARLDFVGVLRRLFGGLERLCVVQGREFHGRDVELEEDLVSREERGRWEGKFVRFFEGWKGENPERTVPEVVILPWRNIDRDIWDELLESPDRVTVENELSSAS